MKTNNTPLQKAVSAPQDSPLNSVFGKKAEIYEGVYAFGPLISNAFENVYYELRKAENRIIDDTQLKRLPYPNQENAHIREWKVRAKSAQRVIAYLRDITLQIGWILEIGCGNGWFSNQMARELDANIVGVDINRAELIQAGRVFSSANLWFCYLDIFSPVPLKNSFDIIVMNASFQYFPEAGRILDRCLDLMTTHGELHILDTALYDLKEVVNAKKRSRDYFAQVGHQPMSAHYFHHSYDSLAPYSPDYLYTPAPGARKQNKFSDSPFPWVRIRKQ